MKTQTLFGGAVVELNVSSAVEERPASPKIAPTLQAFLELYRLAYNYGEDRSFGRCFEAFLDETLSFLEDRYIGKYADDLVGEMEDFMDEKYLKEEKE